MRIIDFSTVKNSDSDRCFKKYSRTIAYGQRYKSSPGFIAGMINKVLLDLNVTDTKLYTSRGKIQYQTKILAKEIIDEHSKKIGYTAIGFDSRNDMVAQKHSKVKKI